MARRLYRVENPSRGTVLAERALAADGFFTRLRGLLGRRSLPPGEALLIFPCRQVHGFFMAFDIEVLHLSSAGEVLRILHLRRNTAGPWVKGSFYALELPVGTVARTDTREGDLLRLTVQD